MCINRIGKDLVLLGKKLQLRTLFLKSFGRIRSVNETAPALLSKPFQLNARIVGHRHFRLQSDHAKTEKQCKSNIFGHCLIRAFVIITMQ